MKNKGVGGLDKLRALAEDSSRIYCLKSMMDNGKGLQRVPIEYLPFRIGRRQGLGLTLVSTSVSKEHAEIYRDGDVLFLCDLDSTNGTFVNGEQVHRSDIREGDIIHIADFEFRLELSSQDSTDENGDYEEDLGTISLGSNDFPHKLIKGTRELGELLSEGRVTTVFQPIVLLDEMKPLAYEALGRGTQDGLPESPVDLFRIASKIRAEAELSRLFRRNTLDLVGHRSDIPGLFLNTHPAELDQPELVPSLRRVREYAPHLNLVVEIHEQSVADPIRFKEFKAELSALGFRLAYDDFGAGQARLLELAEAPPDYLKFDVRFVRNIDQAPSSKLRWLTSLVAAAHELSVKTVAEGVETVAEAETCRKIGFIYGQGNYYGLPVPIDQI